MSLLPAMVTVTVFLFFFDGNTATLSGFDLVVFEVTSSIFVTLVGLKASLVGLKAFVGVGTVIVIGSFES